MKKEKNNYIVGLILGIIGVLAILVFFIYFCISFFSKEVQENDVLINSNTYQVTLEEKLPVSDDFGKNIKEDNNYSFGYLEFEIYNNVDFNRNYEVYMTEIDNNLEINPSYVKLYLTDENDNYYNLNKSTKIPTYKDFKYLDEKPSSKLLYSGSLKAKENKKFKLRVWLTDSYVITSRDLSFKFEIGVRAV